MQTAVMVALPMAGMDFKHLQTALTLKADVGELNLQVAREVLLQAETVTPITVSQVRWVSAVEVE